MDRALGFLRNLRRLHARMGTSGLAELAIARTCPRGLSYQRVTLISAPMTGGARSGLETRRIRSAEPDVDGFFATLARTAEPEVPQFSPADLRRRFAAGHELWLFSVDGRIAHARWIVADRLRFAGGSIALVPGERATEAVVTLPEYRARGLNRAAREDVRFTLSQEGVTRMMSAINGFNRAFTTNTLGILGAETVAVVHVASLPTRRWLRASPASATGERLLEERGLPTGRWIPHRADDGP